MKIVIDSAIPFIKGVFEPYSKVVYLEGREISHNDIKDADALVIRTRTRCNEALLQGSKVKLITTATIGYDHIDLAYCERNRIKVTTAQGCNARGVLQWISASLSLLSRHNKLSPEQLTIGVVGVGNVGKLVREYALSWGFRVVCCDPPRAQREGLSEFISFEQLLTQVDIVTFHTPLNDSTYHMLNTQTIRLLKPSAAIINTSRGEVVDSDAICGQNLHPILLDVWEQEPNINIQLLEQALVSTPHIAGYSLQGKANGTMMVVRELARHFDLPLTEWYPDVEPNFGVAIEWQQMQQTIKAHFDIEAESMALKRGVERFESLRNNYNYRTEYF